LVTDGTGANSNTDANGRRVRTTGGRLTDPGRHGFSDTEPVAVRLAPVLRVAVAVAD